MALCCAATSGAEPLQVAGSQPLVFEDPLEPLRPQRLRSEAEAERTEALGLFTAARVLEQRQDYAGALKLYQRALRFDPQSLAILRAIVPLAFNLDRHAEAVRYALIFVERDASDPVLLRRLGLYLTETGELERAIALYEKAAKLQAKDQPSATAVLLAAEMGRLYYLNRNYVLAARQFERVERALANPKDFALDDTLRKAIVGEADLTYQLFGETFLEAGEFDRAAAAFHRAHAHKPDPAGLAYHLARLDARRKRPNDALKVLRSYFDLKAASQGVAPYELLAQILEITGKRSELLPELEKLHAADSGNQALARYLAAQYAQSGQHEKAVAIYHKVIAANAQPDVEAYQGLLGIYHKRGSVSQALDLLAEFAAKVEALAPLGDAYRAVITDKKFAPAVVKAGRDLLGQKPQRGGPILASGLLALDLKEYDQAEALLQGAIAAEPARSASVLSNWGLALFLENQYERAAKVLQMAARFAAGSADAAGIYFYLAGALEMSGRTDDALAAARKAAEIEKESPRVLSRVAWIEYHARRHADAKQSYQALIKQFQGVYDSPETREVLRDARLVLSNIAVAQSNLPEAEEWLEQVLDEFPEDIGALNDLGYLWAEQGKHPLRALEMIERAVKAEPENKAYRDSLGWALYRLGRYNEAVEQLTVAASEKEPDGVILDHLGDALVKAGKNAQAIETWSRAISALEKQGEAAKARLVQEKVTRLQEPKPAAAHK